MAAIMAPWNAAPSPRGHTGCQLGWGAVLTNCIPVCKSYYKAYVVWSLTDCPKYLLKLCC